MARGRKALDVAERSRVADPGRMGTRFVNTRRMFLGQVVMLVAAVARRAWAQAYDSVRYQPLVRPVVVPLDDLTMPAKAFPFTADRMTLASAAEPYQPARLHGMVVPLSTRAYPPGRLKPEPMQC